jgi:hypothetical protein
VEPRKEEEEEEECSKLQWIPMYIQIMRHNSRLVYVNKLVPISKSLQSKARARAHARVVLDCSDAGIVGSNPVRDRWALPKLLNCSILSEGGSLLEGKAAGAWSWPLTSI